MNAKIRQHRLAMTLILIFFNKVDLSHIFLMFNINILYHLFLSHFKTCLKTSAACAYEKKKIS